MQVFKRFEWRRLQNERFANLVGFVGATVFAVDFAWAFAFQPPFFGTLLLLAGIGGTFGLIGQVALMPDPPAKTPRRSRTAARPSYRPIRR